MENNNSMIKNIQKKAGFVVLMVPLIIASISLVGTGVFAGLDHEKTLSVTRDEQRSNAIKEINTRLAEYHRVNKTYPVNLDEKNSGQSILTASLGEIPNEPLKAKGLSFWYWSNGQSYTIRYFQETTRAEILVSR